MSDIASPTPKAVTNRAEKVRAFPATPGVYLMKDAQGRVVYVGKAKNLRSRAASSYFNKTAADDKRIKRLDRRSRRHRLPRRRQRGRRPPARSPARSRTSSPGTISRFERRQVVPLPPDHHRRRLPPGSTSPREPAGQAASSSTARSPGPRASGGRSRSSRRSSNSGPARSTSRRATPALAVVPTVPAPLDRPVHRTVQPADRQARPIGRTSADSSLFLDGKKDVRSSREMQEPR